MSNSGRPGDVIQVDGLKFVAVTEDTGSCRGCAFGKTAHHDACGDPDRPDCWEHDIIFKPVDPDAFTALLVHMRLTR